MRFQVQSLLLRNFLLEDNHPANGIICTSLDLVEIDARSNLLVTDIPSVPVDSARIVKANIEGLSATKGTITYESGR